MWIVVIVEHSYPSVFHFDNEKEAREKFEVMKKYGYVSHVAKVEDSNYNVEELRNSTGGNMSAALKDISMLNIEWY